MECLSRIQISEPGQPKLTQAEPGQPKLTQTESGQAASNYIRQFELRQSCKLDQGNITGSSPAPITDLTKRAVEIETNPQRMEESIEQRINRSLDFICKKLEAENRLQ